MTDEQRHIGAQLDTPGIIQKFSGVGAANRAAALACNRGGDTLLDFFGLHRVGGKLIVGMAVGIDKAGGDHLTGSINYLFGIPIDCRAILTNLPSFTASWAFMAGLPVPSIKLPFLIKISYMGISPYDRIARNALCQGLPGNCKMITVAINILRSAIQALWNF